MPSMPDPALEAEIVRLDDLGLTALRDLWAERLGAMPKHQSADLMRRRLAYELQVLAYGGLKSETRRRLRRLYEAFKADPAYTPLPNYSPFCQSHIFPYSLEIALGSRSPFLDRNLAATGPGAQRLLKLGRGDILPHRHVLTLSTGPHVFDHFSPTKVGNVSLGRLLRHVVLAL